MEQAGAAGGVTPTRYGAMAGLQWGKIFAAGRKMEDSTIIIVLLADLCPAGILPLSFGMTHTGYVPALAGLVLFGASAGYTMWLVARSMEVADKKSYEELWSHAIGADTAWVPSAVIFAVSWGCCQAYACMFVDLLQLGFKISWLPRCFWVFVAMVILTPLCRLKDFSALAPSSSVVLAAVVFTTGTMVARFFDGSYSTGAGGRFNNPDASYLVPYHWREDHMWTVGPSSLLLVNDMALAFLCHYNGCKYYREYEFPDSSAARFGKCVAIAFGACVAVFGICMTIGYATFGISAAAVILDNYAPNDPFACLARIAMALANILTLPLMFTGLRDSALALLKKLHDQDADPDDEARENKVTTGLLLGISLTAFFFTDVATLVGLVGAIAGSTIIYVLPCLIFEFTIQKHEGKGEEALVFPSERRLVCAIGSIGCILVVAGTWALITASW